MKIDIFNTDTVATSVGIYFTGSAWCLWAMILPACISLKSSKKDDEDNG